MQKWEYLEIISVHLQGKRRVKAVNEDYLDLNRKPLVDFYPYLQELGQKGWELIGFKEDTFYFKRPAE